MNVVRSALGTHPFLGFSKSGVLFTRNYAFKSDLKIKWVRPEKIPCYKPAKSGDLEAFPNVDKSQPQLKFRHSQELNNANDIVRKLFSLGFSPRKKTTEVYFQEMVQRVKRHPYDVGSVEVKIAKWTGVIRTYQELMERFPRNVRLKVVLKELIDRRKKQLKYLRRWDYKRFEWLLETLNLVYKPPPNHFHWITRKESLQKLTTKYCEDIKQQRLDEYKKMLENEQPLFLQEKIRALQFIRDEEVDCGVEVTVTEKEIEDVKQQLETLLMNRNNKQNV